MLPWAVGKMEEAVKGALRGSQDLQMDVSSVARGAGNPVPRFPPPQPLRTCHHHRRTSPHVRAGW